MTGIPYTDQPSGRREEVKREKKGRACRKTHVFQLRPRPNPSRAATQAIYRLEPSRYLERRSAKASFPWFFSFQLYSINLCVHRIKGDWERVFLINYLPVYLMRWLYFSSFGLSGFLVLAEEETKWLRMIYSWDFFFFFFLYYIDEKQRQNIICLKEDQFMQKSARLTLCWEQTGTGTNGISQDAKN